jgi:hypothetical protein
METIKNDMLNLYYKNIDIQAKKYKVNVILPQIAEEPVNIADVIDNTTDITETEQHSITQSITDDFVYKKPWNKLNSVHKVIKIKEFINTMTIDDIEMKKHLRSQLIDMIKKKKLTKKNDVEYDQVNGRILSIPALQYKNNNYNIVV